MQDYLSPPGVDTLTPTSSSVIIPFPLQTPPNFLENQPTEINNWFGLEYVEQLLGFLGNLTKEYLIDLCVNSEDKVAETFPESFIEQFAKLRTYKFTGLLKSQEQYVANLSTVAFSHPLAAGNFDLLFSLSVILCSPVIVRETFLKRFFQDTKIDLLKKWPNIQNGDRYNYEQYLDASIRVLLSLAKRILDSFKIVYEDQLKRI